MWKFKLWIFMGVLCLCMRCSMSFFMPQNKQQPTFAKAALLQNYRPYDFLMLRYHSLWQKEEDKKTFNTSLTIQAQEKIVLSLQKSGFQIFKAALSPIKLTAINYLGDEFFEDTALMQYGFDVHDLENIFLGRLDTNLLDKISFDAQRQFFVLPETLTILKRKIEKTTYIHPKTYLIDQITLVSEHHWDLTIQYEYPKRSKKDFLIPQRIHFQWTKVSEMNSKTGKISAEKEKNWQNFSLKVTSINLSPNTNRLTLKVPIDYQKTDRLEALFR